MDWKWSKSIFFPTTCLFVRLTVRTKNGSWILIEREQEKEFQVVDDDITVKIKKKRTGIRLLTVGKKIPKYCCAFLRINKNLWSIESIFSFGYIH
jgi:hypothetical protein